MIKKSFLALAAMTIFFASCEKKESLVLTEEQTHLKSISVVYPEDGDANVVEGEASMASYRIKYDLVASTCAIMCSDLKVNGSSLSFGTDQFRMNQNVYDVENVSYIVNSADVDKNIGVGNTTVSDLELFITNAVYDLKLPALGVNNDYGSNVGLYLQYELNGKYEVKTFLRDTYYCGKTVTTYPSNDGMQSFQNDNIKYRVVVDLDKKKADVVLYDAKFAEPAPSIGCMVLRGLDITYFDEGFQIVGQDIQPEVIEGDAATPNPRYVFNQFVLKSSSDDLMNVECDYTVATVFKGRFTGASSRITNI